MDYHLVTDLLPMVSKLYFLGRMPSARMSHLQEAILLAMGLQHRYCHVPGIIFSAAPSIGVTRSASKHDGCVGAAHTTVVRTSRPRNIVSSVSLDFSLLIAGCCLFACVCVAAFATFADLCFQPIRSRSSPGLSGYPGRSRLA